MDICSYTLTGGDALAPAMGDSTNLDLQQTWEPPGMKDMNKQFPSKTWSEDGMQPFPREPQTSNSNAPLEVTTGLW